MKRYFHIMLIFGIFYGIAHIRFTPQDIACKPSSTLYISRVFFMSLQIFLLSISVFMHSIVFISFSAEMDLLIVEYCHEFLILPIWRFYYYLVGHLLLKKLIRFHGNHIPEFGVYRLYMFKSRNLFRTSNSCGYIIRNPRSAYDMATVNIFIIFYFRIFLVSPSPSLNCVNKSSNRS
jgi:hypothetical protein